MPVCRSGIVRTGPRPDVPRRRRSSRRARRQAFWTAILATLDEADWAPAICSICAASTKTGRSIAACRGAPCAIVHREVRAFLESDLEPEAYYERAVRQKKRKEIRRLRNRLAELGPVAVRTPRRPPPSSTPGATPISRWRKPAGRAGRAARSPAGPKPSAFFRAAVARRLGRGHACNSSASTSASRTIAMLVNFLTPPGSFSFKTVFDEDLCPLLAGRADPARESRTSSTAPDIAWMDSCAAEDHPMIDSLWTERRAIVRVRCRSRAPAAPPPSPSAAPSNGARPCFRKLIR